MDKETKWVKTYNHLLEEAQVFLTEAEETIEKTSLSDVLDLVKKEIEDVADASTEEIHIISEYLKRDIHSVMDSVKQTQKGFKEWLPFEVELAESLLWDRMIEAADPTRVELDELRFANITLHTGEITRPTQLVCTDCGEVLDFPKTAKIPECPKCQANSFIRSPLNT